MHTCSAACTQPYLNSFSHRAARRNVPVDRFGRFASYSMCPCSYMTLGTSIEKSIDMPSLCGWLPHRFSLPYSRTHPLNIGEPIFFGSVTPRCTPDAQIKLVFTMQQTHRQHNGTWVKPLSFVGLTSMNFSDPWSDTKNTSWAHTVRLARRYTVHGIGVSGCA